MAYERKYKVTKTISDIWNYYKMLNPDSELNQKIFKEILYELNRTISELIIKESFEYKIPHRLGFLRIRKLRCA